MQEADGGRPPSVKVEVAPPDSVGICYCYWRASVANDVKLIYEFSRDMFWRLFEPRLQKDYDVTGTP